MAFGEFRYERGIDKYEWAYQRNLPYFYNEEHRVFVVTTNITENDNWREHPGFSVSLPLDLHFRPNAEEIAQSLKPDGFCRQTDLIWDDYFEFDM